MIESVEKEKLIAIVRGVEKEKLIPLVDALKEGGVRLVELTYSANKKIPDEETAKMIAELVAQFGNQMFIGAGTVLTEAQVELTKAAGGQFIISPDVYEPVIRRTKELGMVSMPGALTPTEIRTAVRAGADFVKVFPTSTMGSAYIKAIAAPLSDVKMLAVGGVNDENMSEFYKAGAIGFGIGTNITDKKLIEANDYAGIAALAERYVAAARALGK
ncbi:MAG: bifunctional 4-hydroxy-2-oxoglutarate aldolase/2-dehydro-3-deoxy-phosphogluconate aldolase [Clostridia bacterium]|nr:bifunctional 4-hydroxy-2-oxoglutarate aldolase/2-dehydro-3-deoxy-phosphogluconate aldolase [Clostridia bacterium]